MSTLQTLERGLLALDIISRRDQGISVADLATELGVHRAICYRIVNTLEVHAFVTRTEDGLVRLGAGAAVLASRFAPQLWHSTGPVLQRLADNAGATTHLSVAQGLDCIAVVVAEPVTAVIRVGYRVGSRHPLTRGAAGIAILSARPPRTSDPANVRDARRDSFSVTLGELEPGAMGIAAPIAVPAGPTAVQACVGVVAAAGLDVTSVSALVVETALELGAVVRA